MSKMRPTTVQIVPSDIDSDVGPITPKFVIINASTSPNNEIVAAVIGKKIRVLSYIIILGAATTIRFESSAGGTALTGQMEIAANSGIGASFNPLGHFETVAGENLNLELSAGNNADGHLSYIEV